MAGRSKSDKGERLDAQVYIRLSKKDLADIRKAAKLSDEPVTTWIREGAVQRARRILAKPKGN